MAFEKMTPREQVLAMIVVLTLAGGAYTLFRYIPKTKQLSAESAQLEANKKKLANPVFPDEPNEDAEELQEDEADVVATLNAAKQSLEAQEKYLAPIEGQDMVLKISEAARTAGVRIVQNVPYLVARKEAPTVDPNKANLSKRAQRKLDRQARKKAKKQGGAAALGAGGAEGAAPKEGELIYHLVNDFAQSRPLQQISVEGSFNDLQKFMQAVANMQYQATIVKFDVEVKLQTPTPGLPQPLMAKMIVAM